MFDISGILLSLSTRTVLVLSAILVLALLWLAVRATTFKTGSPALDNALKAVPADHWLWPVMGNYQYLKHGFRLIRGA